MSPPSSSTVTIRPRLITVLALIWGILGGILMLVGILSGGGVVWLLTGGLESALTADVNSPLGAIIVLLVGPFLLIIVGILSILVSLPALLACRGLMRMKRQGIVNCNSASSLFLLFNLISLPFTLTSLTLIFHLAFAAISSFSLIYLNQKRVRCQFS